MGTTGIVCLRQWLMVRLLPPAPSAGEIIACVCGVVVGEMREAWQGEAGGEKRNSFQKI